MFIIGLSLTCFSVPFAIYMLDILNKTNSNPYKYQLANGITESTVENLVVLSIVMACVGVCLMIFGWVNRRNKAALNSIENHSKSNYCPNCNLNISGSSNKCPICGNKLNVR